MESSTFLWTPILIILVEILLGGYIAKTLFHFAQYYWKSFIQSQTQHPKKKKKKKKHNARTPRSKKSKRYSSDEEEVFEEDDEMDLSSEGASDSYSSE